jgi:hypothetical protein
MESKCFDYLESKIEYAVGIIEMTQVLINTQDNELIKENIKHLQSVLPKALKELKNSIRE